MTDDMMVRNFVEKTRNDDIRHVKTLAASVLSEPEMLSDGGCARRALRFPADRTASRCR
jgi:hypothetical protein